MVMVMAEAELFVNVFIREVMGTVPAFAVTVTVLFVVTTWEKVWVPVKVWAASVRAIVAEVVGNVITVESVPDSVSVFVTANVFKLVSVSVPVVVEMVSPFTEVGVMAPATIVRAGVAPPEDEPENPFAVAIETAVTVPVPFAFN